MSYKLGMMNCRKDKGDRGIVREDFWLPAFNS